MPAPTNHIVCGYPSSVATSTPPDSHTRGCHEPSARMATVTARDAATTGGALNPRRLRLISTQEIASEDRS
jgi:hypothetical protein